MAHESTGAFLRSCPVFTGVPARDMTALAAVAREETYQPRDYVFAEGDRADWLWRSPRQRRYDPRQVRPRPGEF